MADGTAASRDEIGRALEALTPGQLLKLKHFAAWRMRGLGRAACGRIWEDLLGEAWLAILEGGSNNGCGRLWKRNVDLVTQLTGAMRSISSHWKRDFHEQEADLNSEIPTGAEEDCTTSPLDRAISQVPSQERDVTGRQLWSLLVRRCQGDPVGKRVLEGMSRELTASQMIQSFGLTRWEYQHATLRVRRRLRDLEQERRGEP